MITEIGGIIFLYFIIKKKLVRKGGF